MKALIKRLIDVEMGRTPSETSRSALLERQGTPTNVDDDMYTQGKTAFVVPEMTKRDIDTQ